MNLSVTTSSQTTPLTSRSTSQTHYLIRLSGTHVTGKETIAFSLSKTLGCTWIKGEAAHAAANSGARAQAGRASENSSHASYDAVYQRIWIAKMARLGLVLQPPGPRLLQIPADKSTPDASSELPLVGQRESRCVVGVITTYANRRPARDAIRLALVGYNIRPIFVILQISKETLSGRTLGAEEDELAERIMDEKVRDIEIPGEEEFEGGVLRDSRAGSPEEVVGGDILVVNSDDGRGVDDLFEDILRGLGRLMDGSHDGHTVGLSR